MFFSQFTSSQNEFELINLIVLNELVSENLLTNA